MNTTTRFATLLGLTFALGCFGKPDRERMPATSSVDASAAPTPMRVKADGACLQLGELQQPTVSPEMLLAKVGEHATAGRRESARRLVLRFPDVAEDLLRSCDSAKAADPTVQFIAACQDSIAGGTAWQTWLQELNGPAKTYAVQRAEALGHLKAGKNEAVAKASFSAPPGVGRVDAHRIMGQAMLMTEKPKDAANLYAEAAKAAATDDFQASQCLLLQGETLRRAGQAVEARALWIRAVESAAKLLDRPEPVFDPGFWERAAYLKPVDVIWPESAVQSLAKLAQMRTVSFAAPAGAPPEMWLWIASGQARMDRGEYHSALAAFKRGETMTTDANVRAALAVAQARVLLFLGQTKPATAMLASLADRKDSPYASSALAILGAMKLADGANGHALSLLRRAVEANATNFPGRSEAEADLALAYLSTNNEEAGLRWLASAQQRFRADGEHELLERSQANEARYWESRGRGQTTSAASAPSRN